MKKANVSIGNCYLARISGTVVSVRLDADCPYGGWWATNLSTGRTVRIKTAAKLRGPA